MVEPGFAALVRKSSRFLDDDIQAVREAHDAEHAALRKPTSPVLSFAASGPLPSPDPPLEGRKSKGWQILTSHVVSNPVAAALQQVVREASDTMLFRVLSKEAEDRSINELR